MTLRRGARHCRSTPSYLRRALEAHEEADGLRRDARQLSQLARTLREASAGRVTLVRCAWCDSFKVGKDRLHLEAIGGGQQRIAAELRAKATHGICPDRFDAEMRRLRATRRPQAR
jgi:hypothetical protein